jgi:hypothetical protein
MIRAQERVVQSSWMIEGHNNIIVYGPPTSSEYALCYILYKNSNSEKKDVFIENAAQLGLEPDHVKTCLVIARNIDSNDLSYHFIGLYR